MDALEAQGISVWRETAVAPDESADVALKRAIAESDHLILVISPNTVASHHVMQELEVGRALGKEIKLFTGEDFHQQSLEENSKSVNKYVREFLERSETTNKLAGEELTNLIDGLDGQIALGRINREITELEARADRLLDALAG
jgi:hypothetical protein